MAQAGQAGGNDRRVDRNLLPTLAIRRRRIGHPPSRAAVTQHHVTEVSAACRPREAGNPAVAGGRAAGLNRVPRACSLGSLCPDPADRQPVKPFIARFLQVQDRRSDNPARERFRVDVDQAHFLNALEFEPGRAAVMAVGFPAHRRDPGIVRHKQAH